MGIIERVFGFEISIPGFFLVGNIFKYFFGCNLIQVGTRAIMALGRDFFGVFKTI